MRLVLSLAAIAVFGSGHSPAVGAAPIAPELTLVRTLATNDVFSEEFFSAGKPDLSGVGFPPGAHTLLLNHLAGASIVLAVLPNDKKGKISRTPIEIPDPVNTAFDSVTQGAKGFGLSRLFLLDAKLGKLIAIQAGPRDLMEPARIRRFDVRGLGIINPQGMTLDPDNGRLYILDGAGLRLVILDPKPGRKFAGANVFRINLSRNLGALRGLAFNPSNRHLYVLSPQQQKLHELTLNGERIVNLDLSGQPFGVAQGLVFAPSLDSTDIPSNFHLYLVTNRATNGETTEGALPGPF